MKRVIAVILTSLLVTPPASAAEKPGKPIDWQKAKTLRAGTEIFLTTTDGQPEKVRLLFVDETTLVTLKTTSQKMPDQLEKLLFKIGPKWPAVLNGSATVTKAPLCVSKDGIVYHDQKWASLANVVQQTSRGDVQQIAKVPGHGLRNTLVITGVVAVGILVFIAATIGAEGG